MLQSRIGGSASGALALYPKPDVPAATANGGIGYDDVSSPQKLVAVRVGPIITPAPIGGDLIALYWGEDPDDPELDLKPIAAQLTIQDHTTYYVLNVPAGFVFNVGSGQKTVFFRLRTQGAWLYSEVESVDVKLDKPGGGDPDADTEWVNENLLAPEPEYTTIGPDQAATGVDVTVPRWINIAEGDRLTLAWSTERIDCDPLAPGDLDDQVVHVPPKTIEDGGDGDGLIVRYQIYDRVKNWSKWSLEARVNVEIDPNLLARPVVTLAPLDELDLDTLGSQDVQVMVMDPRIKPQSKIDLTWNGRTAEGNPVVRTVQGTMVGAFLFLDIPNEAAVAIAQGLAVLLYTATLAGEVQRSRRTTLRVIGEVKGLDAPEVEEAVDQVISPAGPATVRVAPYTIMDAGDVVLMRWAGTKANGESTLYTADRLITNGTKGQPVRFPIDSADLSVLDGGSVRVSYWVYPAAGGGPLEAPDEVYRISAVGADLPRPEVAYLDTVSLVLDPDRVPAGGTTLTVPAGALTQDGDDVNVEWLGQTGQPADTYRDSVPVTSGSAGRALPFPITKALVTNNRNAEVTARYDVVRNGKPLPSQPLTFRVATIVADLPMPRVKEAPSGSLNPVAAKDNLTAIVAYPNPDLVNDEVQVTWAGNGASGSFTSAWIKVSSAQQEVPLDPKVVAFNLGRSVEVSYALRRGGVPAGDSLVLTLPVESLDTSPGGPLPTPQLKEAVGGVVDVGDIDTQGHVTVTPPWPLIAVDQLFWLDLEGTKEDGSPALYPQAVGVKVTANHVINGLTNRQVPESFFKDLKDGSTLRLKFWVSFDKGTDKAQATPFPERSYTVKAVEYLTPEITSVKDANNVEIPIGGTTVSATVTLTGTATANLEVEIFDGTVSKGKAPVNASGIWTLPVTGLAVGPHSFTAKATYGSNPVSPARTLTVAAAAAPAITSVKDDK
ncbi:Ig-like domain-containing protein, partial [Burkholderia pyrrocinia]